MDLDHLQDGDRVRALRRSDFPDGVVVQKLANDFLLVRWSGDLLETVHRSDVTLVEPNSD